MLYNLKTVFDRQHSLSTYTSFHFVNHHSLVQMVKSQIVIRDDHFYFVDGIFLSGILKVLGVKHSYLPGPSFFRDHSFLHGKRTLFVVANEATELSLRSKGHSYILVAPIIDQSNIEMFAKKILAFQAQHVVLGIGSPSQDKLANQIALLTKITQVYCIGAAVEFYAGTQKQAHIFFKKTKLEWFWRLLTNFSVTYKRITVSVFDLFWFFIRGDITW